MIARPEVLRALAEHSRKVDTLYSLRCEHDDLVRLLDSKDEQLAETRRTCKWLIVLYAATTAGFLVGAL